MWMHRRRVATIPCARYGARRTIMPCSSLQAGTQQTATETAEEKGGLVEFRRLFIPNVSFLITHFRSPIWSRCAHAVVLFVTSIPFSALIFHILLLDLYAWPAPLQQPDLTIRLMYDLPLAEPDHATFYLPGDLAGKNYIDFPTADVTQNGSGETKVEKVSIFQLG
jgi:hypothetical protein